MAPVHESMHLEEPFGCGDLRYFNAALGEHIKGKINMLIELPQPIEFKEQISMMLASWWITFLTSFSLGTR